MTPLKRKPRPDQSQIGSLQATTQSAQAQVQVAQSQLSAGRAQERQAQAVLDQAKISLAHTRITAPVDGTVIAPAHGCGPDRSRIVCGSHDLRRSRKV